MALPNSDYLASKKANLSRIPKLTRLELSWINNNYNIFKNVSIIFPSMRLVFLSLFNKKLENFTFKFFL